MSVVRVMQNRRGREKASKQEVNASLYPFPERGPFAGLRGSGPGPIVRCTLLSSRGRAPQTDLLWP